MDYKLDESYTPKTILIRCGSCEQDKVDMKMSIVSEHVSNTSVEARHMSAMGTNRNERNQVELGTFKIPHCEIHEPNGWVDFKFDE